MSEADLSQRLGECYTAVLHDVMRGMGLSDFTLPPGIRPLDPARRFAGPAYTVRGNIREGADPDETLLAWTGLLSRAKPGHVVVCQPNDHSVAHMGELSAETLKLRGVLAYVVDGGCRDVESILELGFPVCCRYYTPKDIVGQWLPEAFDEPIEIGSARICAGDYLCGDRDGQVVVPREHAARVAAAAEQAIQTENAVRTAIRGGMDPQDAYRRYGKF